MNYGIPEECFAHLRYVAPGDLRNDKSHLRSQVSTKKSLVPEIYGNIPPV